MPISMGCTTLESCASCTRLNSNYSNSNTNSSTTSSSIVFNCSKTSTVNLVKLKLKAQLF